MVIKMATEGKDVLNRRVDSEKKKWKNSETEKLIQLLECHPCLFNTTLKEYHDRDLKKKTFESFAAELGRTGKPVSQFTEYRYHSW